MNALVEWGKKHPTRVVALIALIVTTAAPFLPAVLATFLGAALAILIGKPLHDAVIPVDVAVDRAAQATEAVVEQLDGVTVGPIGMVPAAVKGTIEATVGAVLRSDS